MLSKLKKIGGRTRKEKEKMEKVKRETSFFLSVIYKMCWGSSQNILYIHRRRRER